jgi:hypothetical protein
MWFYRFLLIGTEEMREKKKRDKGIVLVFLNSMNVCKPIEFEMC